MSTPAPAPAPAATAAPETDALVHPLPNGVRVLVLPQPGRQAAQVSIFVRSGSQHEPPALNGIGHVVEHMAFKGTATRSCQRINLDAEILGAEVNAHTDKDHTAFHIEGLAGDCTTFIGMLGDIVLHSTWPEDELAREKQVILQELAEDDDDPFTVAFRLFDEASWGEHPFAQPVIGQRRCIERFTRTQIIGHAQRQYTGANVIVAVAGDVDVAAMVRAAEAAFGDLPRGEPNVVGLPTWHGGIRSKRLPGSGQTHVVLGYAIPGLQAPHHAHVVAAALFGEGMSSPLLDEVRERRGLAYAVSCSADVAELGGQFVVEASTAPADADELLVAVRQLLLQHAQAVDLVGLERARRQLVVRSLRNAERPGRRLENAALDLFVHGRVQPPAQWRQAVLSVTAAQVQDVFAAMLATTPAVAVTGSVGPALKARVQALFGGRAVAARAA